MKKLLSLLTVLFCLSFALVSVQAAETSGTCGENLTWVYDADTYTLTISGEGEMADYTFSKTAPWSKLDVRSAVVEEGVTSLGNLAFNSMDEFLTSVELPETLTYIGENAFSGCSNLGPLTIPAGVTEISSNAFSSMGAVRNWGDTIDWCTVIFEGDAPVFAKDAFYRSCLRVYYDAKNETWDGVVNHSFGSTRDAWMGGSCGNGGAVKWMVTPDGTLTIFGSGAMLGYFSYSGSGYDNYSLDFRPWDRHPGDIHTVIIEEGVTSIGSGAFADYSVGDYDTNFDSTQFSFPDSLTEIGAGAFLDCSGLKKINIPDGMTKIGAYTFDGCDNLAEVTIPNGVTEIAKNAFYGCSALEELTLPDGVTEIANNAFSGCSALEVITLPDTVTTIGSSAFYECESLAKIDFPSSLTELGTFAFYRCTSLSKVRLPDGLTEVNSNLFVCCTGLTEVTIPDSVEAIQWCAFGGCTSLTEITIPQAVTCIRGEAFSGCTSLTEIRFQCPAIEIDEDAFQDVTATAIIPMGDTSWTKGYRRDYGGTLTWDMDCPGHQSVVDEGMDATCTKFGMTDGSHCELCGWVLVEQKAIPELGHDIDWTNKMWPTCIADGWESGHVCQRCDYGKVWIPKSDDSHWYDNLGVGLDPTCTEGGFEISFKCRYCGDLVFEYPLDALGHNFVNGKCSRCGVFSSGYVPSEPIEPDQPNKPDQPEIPTVKFNDVAADAWYAAPVSWAVSMGVTNGIAEGQFGPDQNCTRAQVVTFLWRAAGSPEPSSSANPFTDVDSSAWYGKAVLWAVEKGITNGMTATEFGTDMTCTRAQVATFLWRAVGQPAPASSTNPFNDVDASAWYGKAVLWAVENGVTNGMGEGTFAPDGTCTRGQIVTFLYRAIG